MTLQSVRGVNYIPGLLPLTSVSYPAQGTHTLDADGEYVAAVFKVSKAGSITKIGVRTGTVTAADPIVVSLETVDATSGQPSGTMIDSPTNKATGTIASPSASTCYWVSLTAAQTVTLNQLVAIKCTLTYTDGNLQIASYVAPNTYGSTFPYIARYQGSAYATSAYVPNFGLEYSDGTIEWQAGMFPAAYTASVAWGSNDSPDRRGLRFQVPYACSIIGGFLHVDGDEEFDVLLYDSDGSTVLETVSAFDKDVRGDAAARCYHFLFSQSRTLTKNTYYRLVCLPKTTTDIGLSISDVTDDGANQAMNAMDGGIYFHYTTVNGAPANDAAWTQTLTRRPWIGLLVDKLDDGAGGAETIKGRSGSGTFLGMGKGN